MTLFALVASVVVGVGSLAWGYTQVGLPLYARWILVFGVLWLVAIWQRWRWFAYLGLAFNLLAAALGLWFTSFPPGWMFAGAIGGLLAFDLTDFYRRLSFSASSAERHYVEMRHLRRVTLLGLIGFLLASLAMILTVRYSFEWALLLTVMAVLGVLQLVAWYRKRG